MMVDISGRRALVTGASRGIGKAITHALLRAGAHVIATSRAKRNLEMLSDELQQYAGRLYTLASDLRQIDEVTLLCKRIRELGAPEIIVNNAGVLHFDLLTDLTDTKIQEAFSINVIAPIKICRTFVPDMISRRWGRIVNLCSSSAYSGGGTPRHCVYSASKHALLGFSRALDEELREHNIRVTTVSPAGVNTEMIADRKDLDPETFMSVEDVAEVVMYQIVTDGPGIVYEMRLWRMHR